MIDGSQFGQRLSSDVFQGVDRRLNKVRIEVAADVSKALSSKLNLNRLQINKTYNLLRARMAIESNSNTN